METISESKESGADASHALKGDAKSDAKDSPVELTLALPNETKEDETKEDINAPLLSPMSPESRMRKKMSEEAAEEDDEAARQEALRRTAEAREKVAAARYIVDSLHADRANGDTVDGRKMHMSCIERGFFYNYDNGNLKTSFVSAPGVISARPVEVFRMCFTTPANVETLNDILYEANINKVEIDMEEVRIVLNPDYIMMKRDAEREILYRKQMSAGKRVVYVCMFVCFEEQAIRAAGTYKGVRVRVMLCLCVSTCL